MDELDARASQERVSGHRWRWNDRRSPVYDRDEQCSGDRSPVVEPRVGLPVGAEESPSAQSELLSSVGYAVGLIKEASAGVRVEPNHDDAG